MDAHSSNHWSLGLASVIFHINTRTTHTTKKTPYQLVFGQHPRTNVQYWKHLHESTMSGDIVMNDIIIDKISPINGSVIHDISPLGSTSDQFDSNRGRKYFELVSLSYCIYEVNSSHYVSGRFMCNRIGLEDVKDSDCYEVEGHMNEFVNWSSYLIFKSFIVFVVAIMYIVIAHAFTI